MRVRDGATVPDGLHRYGMDSLGTAGRGFCMLASIQTSTLHVVSGCLFRLGQNPAKPWLHVLVPALRAALRPRNGRAGRTGAAA